MVGIFLFRIDHKKDKRYVYGNNATKGEDIHKGTSLRKKMNPIGLC